MAVDPEIQTISSGYLNAIAWGMPAITGFFLLRYLNEGMANILPVMLTGLVGLLVNILANYVLIFGNLGAPRLGGIGAGWATTITHWVMLFCLLFYLSITDKFQPIDIFRADIKPHSRDLGMLLKLGIPIGIAWLVEGSIFSIIALFLASFGVVTVAAHQIALSISSLIFILPLSLSISLSILVGQHCGAQNQLAVRQTILAGYAISVSLSSLSALLLIHYSNIIPGFYTSNAQVIMLASQLMIFTAVYQFSDGIQLCSAGSLRGLKDTAIPMLLSIFAYWLIGFPLGYLLALTDTIVAPMSAKGFWIGIIVGLSLAAVLMTVRLNYILARASCSRHESTSSS
jgi:MATE family multidrug resistance protein